MYSKSLFFILLLIATKLIADEAFDEDLAFHKPKGVESATWHTVKPYLIPTTHPAKKKLDELFAKFRFIQNKKALRQAGFRILSQRSRTQIIVATHPQLKHTLVKLYTDDYHLRRGKKEWKIMLDRIKGVNRVRQYISEANKSHLFKAPRKWLYAVSSKSSADNLKNFVLVEDLMDTLDNRTNFAYWRDEAVLTKAKLDEVYELAITIGYNDGLSPDNLPFCKDGRIAIVDTERVGKWPIRYSTLEKYLPPSLKEYWIKKCIGQ